MIPNTTPTPNIIFNGLMAIMNDTEFRIVMAVVRATLGWEIDKETKMRKKEDWLSNWQLQQITGRSNRALSTRIESCIKKGWIEARDKKGNLLDTPQKRSGKKIFYRLGSEILLKNDNEEIIVKTFEKKSKVSLTPAKSSIEESSIEESAGYKRNTITKEKLLQNTIVGQADKQAIEFNFNDFLKAIKSDKQKHIQIIGLYWEYKGFKFQNKEQAAAALKRELRPAKALVGYPDTEITDTMEWLCEHTDFKWTLESVGKFINEDLDNLEPIKSKKSYH